MERCLLGNAIFVRSVLWQLSPQDSALTSYRLYLPAINMAEEYEPTAPWNERFMNLIADIAYSLRLLSGRDEDEE